MHPIRAMQTFAQGQSYWRVELSTGKVWSQLDTVYDPLRGKPEHKYQRPLDWYLDLVSTGDVQRIKVLSLHSPGGDAAIQIRQPGTAYQLNAAALLLDMGGMGGGRQKDAQIIGRVDDRATGEGVAYIWDVHMRQMYKDEQANIHHFQAWRPGIAALGELSWQNMGVVL